jgi:signal transduction histidine kinase/CheY-like chemotaxis protein
LFEQIAVNLFYQRAVRDHLTFRILGLAVLGAVLVNLGLTSLRFALGWVAILAIAEIALRLWRRAIFLRAATAGGLRRATRLLLGLAALMSALWVSPALVISGHGTVGAAVGVTLCATVLLVVCAQHNLSRWMFYTSGAAPALALTLTLINEAGGEHGWAMVALAFAVLANARSLHHANVTTFRGLVVGKADAEHANAQLQVALAATQQACAAKNIFLATMSHELRTPLNGIIGMADALSRRELEADAAAGLAVIGKSGRALLAILNDVLDLSQIESGRLELRTLDFDLAAAVAEVVDLFQLSARDKGVVLAADTTEAAGTFHGDPARLRQMLANLVANAIKFTPSGEVRIAVHRLPGDEVQIIVRDTGIGMAPETLSRVFARFDQADDSITRNHGGVGLGLTICRELSELMGGEIQAESCCGQGTTVTLRLPLPLVGAASVRDVTPPPKPQAEPEPEPLRVLCAEDNPINQLVLRALLEEIGCAATMADNGQAALDLWRASSWDIVLMDMRMPVMDGLTATRTMRAEEAASGRPRTPVISVTADTLAEQVAEQRAAGIDLHLAKPIEASALAEALGAALAAQCRTLGAIRRVA